MMKILVFVFLALLIGSAFALTDAYKNCVKGCCENFSGTYLWDSNGCENSTDGMTQCVMASCKLDEPQTHACPIGLILPALVGAAFIAAGKRE
jgi:hypothetical protein